MKLSEIKRRKKIKSTIEGSGEIEIVFPLPVFQDRNGIEFTVYVTDDSIGIIKIDTIRDMLISVCEKDNLGDDISRERFVYEPSAGMAHVGKEPAYDAIKKEALEYLNFVEDKIANYGL